MTDRLATLTLRQLRQMSDKELALLANEIRRLLITTISRTGGHLASNLGVVELTLALHACFNSPEDKIVWDVGHQSYVHKLLTGRYQQFPTLRQYGGLSGFPKTRESVHDVFQTGHSSTSISAALGMAEARDLKGAGHHVVAVIGDGAMTGGMAFEALNHAGHSGTPLIVILNDNEMSIAPNVGALSSYLARLRTAPGYSRTKEDVQQLLRRIPTIGHRVIRSIERVKDSLKYLVVPGMLFEEMGFTYLGPLDGHQIGLVRRVLNQAKQVEGPVLVHVVTKKGKGYGPAEKSPDRFHGTGPFDPATGQAIKNPAPPSYTDVFGRTMVELAKERDDVVAITAAMPDGTGLSQFGKLFPARLFDVGIAEEHAVTFAAGLATQGMHPIFAVYSTFLQRAYDQIVHDVALQNLPVVFAVDRAGLVGEDGETHHGAFDLTYLRHIPNLTVMAPKDEVELAWMLRSAVQYKRPVAIRYPRGAGLGREVDVPAAPLPIGSAEVLQEGNHLTIAAVGTMVAVAEAACEQLRAHDIACTLLNVRFIKPLPEEAILSAVQKTGKIITLEENVVAGGFGSAVMELCSSRGIMPKAMLMGLPDHFIEHGSRQQLLKRVGLTTEDVVSKALQLLTSDQ
ncbi:MAG: 1-deoxy-D-xylulose-5-phosphate synthase [Bacillota bacterium]